MDGTSTGSEAIVLTKEDRDQLSALGVTAASIIGEYDRICQTGSKHNDAVRAVFNSFGTASVNQGVYRRVIAAHNRRKRKVK